MHYLIIGSWDSTDWLHSSYGRKIEKALRSGRVWQSIPSR